MNKYLVVVLLSCALAGCGITPEQWNAISQNVAMISAAPEPSSAGPFKMMVFGGPGNQTYLGCLSCNEYESDSIANQYGTYGSKYSADSLLNPYGNFGSKYSSYGACNPYASDPPVVVDSQGNFYGRLTVNLYHPQRMQDEAVRVLLSAICE